jgi:phosphatidylglycerophosphate synthase
MKDSIKHLRKVCQADRLAHDTWHGRYIARTISIYITYVFLKIGISANVATLLLLISGIAGSVLLSFADKGLFFLGTMILQFWFILDHVDGEIARYRATTSLSGYYFDCITHYVSHPLIFLCCGLGFYRSNHSIWLLMCAVVAGYSICMISAIEDIFNSALYKKMLKKKGTSLIGIADVQHITQETPGILKRMFSALHSMCTFPIVMNLLTLAGLFNFFVEFDCVAGIVVFYCVTATLVWVARVFVFIKQKKADALIKELEKQA